MTHPFWNTLKQRIGRWRGVLTIAPTVAGFVALGAHLGAFSLLEWATLDRFFQLRPTEPKDSRIAIVTISEEDIANLGQWPMSDRVMAELLDNIKAREPLAIGMDIYRDLSVAPGARELEEVFKTTPNLIGIEKASGEVVPPPPILAELGQVAASDLVQDADGKVRRGLIWLEGDDGQPKEGLAAKLAWMYLGAEGLEFNTLDENELIYQVGQLVLTKLQGNEGGYVGKEAGGYQILLNYRGGLDRFDRISMTDVLENRIPPDLIRDRIVFIGATADSLKDIFLTPYNQSLLAPERVPGVVIHANLTSHLLSAALDGRPMLKVWGATANWLWIGIWSFVGAAGSWRLLQMRFRNLYLSGTIGFIVIGGSVLGTGSYLMFLAGWMIPVFSPLLALSASAVLIANYHDRWQLKQANQQLAQTNEKLADANQQLGTTNEKLADANQQLEEYSRTLESKVTERTRELQNTLDSLQETQDELIQSEKMAALGQLISGVAHEVNTPLGAIRASVDNINIFLEKKLESLPSFFANLPSDYHPIFLELLRSALADTENLSSRSRRKIKRALARKIKKYNPEYAETIADFLVDLGIRDNIQHVLPIVRDIRSEQILNTAYQLAGLKKSTHTILNATDRAAKVVFALKNYTRYEATGDKIKVKVTDGIETVLNLYQNKLQNGVDVIRNYESHIPLILGYPDEINQIWMNLVHNALQAMDNRGTLAIDVAPNDTHICVKITDSGRGIPSEIQHKIFDPFFTTQPPGEGSGLGLDIVRKIIDRHQGKIEFESIPGKTTFTVSLNIGRKRRVRDEKLKK
ncbi:MAG: CHASE2 domain-containing protein [Cyanobacteriota bacterium]|nr:CHASE2 domain-containing protein [Cyanobacteriota bacterium]